MNKAQKMALTIALFVKAFVSRKQKEKPEGNYTGEAFIDFYNLTPNTFHHGTCAFVLEENVRPEEYSLYHTRFGYSDSTRLGRYFLYAMDWGIAGEEHLANSEKLREIVNRDQSKKILLVGVRSMEGKLWLLYGKPENFLLVHDQFVKALLNQDVEKLKILGATVVGASPVDQDCGSYVFGSTESYGQLIESILAGELEEIYAPQVEDVAVYTDKDDNIVHVGLAQNEEENVIVLSTITGSPFVVKHNPELIPTDVSGEILLRWYRR